MDLSRTEKLQRVFSIIQSRHSAIGTLFNKYGGIATVEKIVVEIYKAVLAKETLAPYFVNTDIDRLISHQVHFLSYVLDDPSKYKEKSLKDAHMQFNISVSIFDEFIEILHAAFLNAGISKDDVSDILAIVNSAKSSIVSDAEMALS